MVEMPVARVSEQTAGPAESFVSLPDLLPLNDRGDHRSTRRLPIAVTPPRLGLLVLLPLRFPTSFGMRFARCPSAGVTIRTVLLIPGRCPRLDLRLRTVLRYSLPMSIRMRSLPLRRCCEQPLAIRKVVPAIPGTLHLGIGVRHQANLRSETVRI